MDGSFSPQIICFGNAIVEAAADADSAWLDRMGITEPLQQIPYDQARRILDELGGLHGTGRITFSAGGAAASAAKTAAMLGTSAAFSGCTGDDELAAFFKKDLKAAGVMPLLKTGKEKTGLRFVFNSGTHSGGKKRTAVSPGASAEFTAADVKENFVAKAETVLLDGSVLERRPLAEHILQLANRRGIPAALYTASEIQIQERTEAILQYSRNYPLIVFMNADECITFYNTIKKGAGGTENASEREKEKLIIKEICPVLKYMTEGEIFPVIVIQLGRGGAAVLAGGNIHRKRTFSLFPRKTADKKTAALSASFCAAFISAWIQGKPIRECTAISGRY